MGLHNDFARIRPEGRRRAHLSAHADAEASLGNRKSFGRRADSWLEPKRQPESARGRKVASHHCWENTEVLSQRGLSFGVAALAKAWCKTRNQKVDSTSLEVLCPFDVSELGQSLCWLTWPTPSAPKVSHLFSGLSLPEPCSFVSRCIRP